MRIVINIGDALEEPSLGKPGSMEAREKAARQFIEDLESLGYKVTRTMIQEMLGLIEISK